MPVKLTSELLLLVLLSWPFNHASASFYRSVDASYSLETDKLEIENMPRFRNTGSFDVCASVSAAAILDFHYCRANKIKDCTKLKPSQEFSTLRITSYAISEGDDMRRIQFGGHPATALENIYARKFKVFPESCAPLDPLSVRDSKRPVGWVADFVKKLEADFIKYQIKYQTEGRICEECISDIKNRLNKNFMAFPETDLIKKAIAEEQDFREFLHDAFFKKCPKESRVKIEPNPVLKIFPETKTQPNYEATIEQIKATLKKGYPLVTPALCPVKDGDKCARGHAVAISGYKKVCKPSGSPCRDLIKVHESGGKELQDKLGGGWVDGKSMFNQLRGEQDLAWLEDPPKDSE